MPISEALGLAALVFWLAVLLDRSRAWPRELRLPASPRAAASEIPPHTLVALVPARNEAESLPRTLPTLLAQGLTVVLVDDGSRDGTADVARRLAAAADRPERLHVVSAPPARSGWSGKVHALEHGLRAAEDRFAGGPEWLLLTDADIAHRPGSAAALLEIAGGDAGSSPRDLVSVMARLHAGSFWERLLIPPFVFFFQLLYPFRRVSRPGSPTAAAAGGCVLVQRETLRAAGGFASVRNAVIDDVALARAIRNAGGRLWLGLDGEIRSVRAYRSLQEIWEMVARTAFVQLRRSAWLLFPTLAALAVLVAAPPFLLAATAIQALAGGTSGRAGLWAAIAWMLQTAALTPVVRHHRVPAVWAATLPVAAIFYGLMTWSSAWRHWRGTGVRWKGRRY